MHNESSNKSKRENFKSSKFLKSFWNKNEWQKNPNLASESFFPIQFLFTNTCEL